MSEKIIEVKTCKSCSAKFEITDKDLEFYEKISPNFGGKKYLIPSPTLCPECRQQRRLVWRNERNLYKRNCDATGKAIISMYSPDKKFKVYDQFIWRGDSWDPLDYSKEFDFSKTFFEQFDELRNNTPLPSMYAYLGENSDYCNCVNYMKDCYLSFASSRDEKCFYSSYTNDSVNCIDSFMTFNCQNCYNTIDCKSCYQVFNSQNCINCSDCYYSKNLNDCSYCFGCSNLSNKKYCIENKQYEKEEYLNKIQELKKGIYVPKETKFNKFMTGINNENVSGDYLNSSKNSFNCFDGSNLEDCKFNIWFHDSKNCYDTYSWGQNSELCYEGVAIGDNCNLLRFCANVGLNSSMILYSIHCESSKNLFGCVGLKNKEYCILNKEYSREDYEKLVPKIIEHMQKTGEWGEFFPANISPFGYNESVAGEYMQISKENAKKLGFNWCDYENPFPKVDKIIKASMLGEDISKIPDDILNWAIECEVSSKPFRIVKAELDFYRKHSLPIPKKHPDQRHLERLKLRNPRKIFDRCCDKCGVNIKTTYSPDRKEIVYCENCFEKEVY